MTYLVVPAQSDDILEAFLKKTKIIGKEVIINGIPNAI